MSVRRVTDGVSGRDTMVFLAIATEYRPHLLKHPDSVEIYLMMG